MIGRGTNDRAAIQTESAPYVVHKLCGGQGRASYQPVLLHSPWATDFQSIPNKAFSSRDPQSDILTNQLCCVGCGPVHICAEPAAHSRTGIAWSCGHPQTKRTPAIRAGRNLMLAPAAIAAPERRSRGPLRVGARPTAPTLAGRGHGWRVRRKGAGSHCLVGEAGRRSVRGGKGKKTPYAEDGGGGRCCAMFLTYISFPGAGRKSASVGERRHELPALPGCDVECENGPRTGEDQDQGEGCGHAALSSAGSRSLAVIGRPKPSDA